MTDRNHTILIVDDSRANIHVFTVLLQKKYHIITATSGEEALDTAPRELPDCILMDIIMPGIDGIAACRELKRNPRTAAIPIIFITARTDAETILQGFEAGGVDYITKPFNGPEVKARIKTHLALKNTMEQLREANHEKDRLLSIIANELELARQIQKSIIPITTPAVKGLNITMRYIPMEEVGGDFFDFHALDEYRLGVLVADVTGHGIPAAMISTMVKIVSSMQTHNAADPAKLFYEMNNTLSGNIDNQFVTAQYVFLDMENMRLICGNGGHPPLLIINRHIKNVQALNPQGRLLGCYPDSTYTSAETLLHKGDRIILYTDGITEVFNHENTMFGEEGLISFTRKNAHLSGDEYIDTLIDELRNFSHLDSFDDDISVVVIDI